MYHSFCFAQSDKKTVPGALYQLASAMPAAPDKHMSLQVLANTVNGTTYAGIRARTTGAPQNHWFGPAGDPRSAGIGTPEAIRLVWSCHREIINDVGPVSSSFKAVTT